MSNDVDVVVVGGGPVGLWLACELALANVRVVVLERRSEQVAQSRALTIHGRTLEIFGMRGLADRFLSRGRRVPTGHFGVLDARLDFSVFDTGFPFTLFLPQATTETLLEQRALELGVDIRRGHLVEQLVEAPDAVAIRARSGTAAVSLSARYVVGADGARSMTRQAAGISFEGYAARHTLMLGDLTLDAPPAQPVISVVNEAGVLMLAPLGDGVHHRLILVDPRRLNVPQSEPVTLAELAEGAARISGQDFGLRDPIWLSRFADETRLATRYRAGRILLAGDAAHIHMPAGGQGMNVGIQDAMNLGWKLAAVARGLAPDALLDSYERERRPVGEALFRNTLAQTALVTEFSPTSLALRDTLDELVRLPDVNRRLADQLSGFGVTYGAPLSAPQQGWAYRAGQSGRRLADVGLTLRDGTGATLYRLLEAGSWLHLRRGGLAATPAVPGSLATFDVGAVEGDGPLSSLAEALIRPDGYLADVVAEPAAVARRDAA